MALCVIKKVESLPRQSKLDDRASRKATKRPVATLKDLNVYRLRLIFLHTYAFTRVRSQSVFTDASQPFPPKKLNEKNRRKAEGTFSLPVGAYANLVFMQKCRHDLYV